MTTQILLGFARTICDCRACTRNCHYVSGMVIPADLDRWATLQGAGFQTWAMTHLAASPGALVMKDGEVFRIPTLVPKRLEGGQCHWLLPRGHCAIHQEAPFGCGYFDAHMTEEEGQTRSSAALHTIVADWQVRGPYSQLWVALYEAGQVAEAPEVTRARMAKEWKA